MAVTYKGNQIEVSMSNQKFSSDVVYARPEDTIKLDFDLKSVKITFVNGDVDFIFPDGSIVSLAAYGVLAFGDNSPKIYDASGSLVSLDSLLQNVEVLKPEDAILILANRDKASLVDVVDNANKVLEATDEDSSSDGGNPVAGPGDSEVPTTGLNSSVINPNGVQIGYDLKNGPGDYMSNPINTTNLDRTTNNSNRLPGNSASYEKSTLVYNFLYGDSATKGNSKSINGNLADYYGINSGTGDDKDSKVQLDQIAMKGLGGDHKYRIFDGHSYDGKVSRVLRLDYSGGIFPESIKIYNIPTDKDANGNLIYQLQPSGNSTFKLSYSSVSGVYTLTQLDGSGKLDLDFMFPQDVADKLISFEYRVSFLDPKSGLEKEIISIQDVSISAVNQESDLNAAQAVLNKGASGISVEAKDTGEDVNIFIGGSTGNKFSSKSPQNLVFTGGGNDVIDLSTIGASASQASNIIYGSTGYDVITGSGSGNDYLIFSNDKSYNKNIDSSAVKDSYYETMKKGVGLQFYFGMDKANVLSTWDTLGISNRNNNNVRDAYTSNFVYSYNSLTVIGDSPTGGGSSITNIVGSVERDIFNLYFQNVSQHINISSGNPKNSNFGDEIVIRGQSKDTVFLTLGDSPIGTLTSANYSSTTSTSYSFDSASFSKFTGSDEQDYIYIKYNGDSNNYYSKTIIFDGGKETDNVVDFSGLVFDSSASDKGITFSANLSYENVLYRGLLNNRLVDYFYNFSKIIGSSGNDIFYGYSASRKYDFDGTSLGKNELSYIKSAAGVAFDMANNKVYKTNDATLNDYSAYEKTADTFSNIQKVTLSNYDDVVIGNLGVNAGSVDFDLGSGNDTIRYDLDTNINHIEVTVGDTEDKVAKYASAGSGSPTNEDKFQKGTRGSMSYIGTSGDDIFYGSNSKSTNFNGLQGNNTLTYTNATLSLNFDLSKKTVSKGGYTDTFDNINNIVGGSGDDIFSFGKFDPTNPSNIPANLSIDGGGGKLNTMSFSQLVLSNLSSTQFALTFEMPNASSSINKISFYDKNNVEVDLSVKNITAIQKIEGTIGNDLFIASEDLSFIFDGGRYDTSTFNTNASSNNANIPIYGNTLSYKNVTSATNLEFDLKAGVVTKTKGGTQSGVDNFANMQGFVGGEGDDTFKVTHSLKDTSKYFDGGGGSNTLSYDYIFSGLTFDLSLGDAVFSSTEKDVFRNINTFTGGYGKNKFVLSEVYNFGNSSNAVSLGGKVGNNNISFESFSSAIGEASNPFELKSNGSFLNSNVAGATTYTWINASGFTGSSNDDFFTIKDNEEFELDGGEGVDTLTYADLVSSAKITVNVFTGSVLRDVSGVRYYDTIANIEQLILGSGDDTVVYSAWNPNNPVANNFISIDGGKGSNTLDFSSSSLIITAEISSASIAVTESGSVFNTQFNNFQNFKASRKSTTFVIDNESNNLDVKLQGNPIIQDDIGSVVDLRNLQGDLVFYNFVQDDVVGGRNPSDYEARLTWNNSYVANIRNSNINKFVFNANNNNTVYGSRHNNTFYSIDGTIPSGKDSILSYADTDFRDILKVYINDDKQIVKFVYQGTEDFFKGFNKFIGSSGNDVFLINDINSIPNNVIYDGGQGNNSLSFEESKASIEIDVSLDRIQLKGNSINIINIQSLVLSDQDDVVNITTTSNNKLLFTSIDGGKGTNKINITSNEILKFNEQGDNVLSLSKNSGSTKISNFQEIRTSTTTGNEFYGSATNDIKFVVEGSNDASINFVTYEQFSKVVKINFYDSSVLKITGKSDSFEGIQYFVGSLAKDIFALDTSFTDNLYKGLFTTIYINYKNSKTPVSNSSIQDTISLVSGNNLFDDGIFFNTNTGTMSKIDGTNEITSVQYTWVNIDTVQFTEGQTVYVSYDKVYNYDAVAVGGNGSQSNNAVLSFDRSKSLNYKADTSISVIIDFVNLTASISQNQSFVLNNIKFSGVTEVVATGNSKDIIYGGSNIGVKYKGISEYKSSGSIINTQTALPTLDYSKFLVVSEGVKVNFNSDNTATIDKPLQNQNTNYATDSIEYIQTIIGTNGQDTFVLADNSNQDTYKIFIDGGAGVIDTVDLSKIGSSGGIILDASSSDVIGKQYHYDFKNINSFLMGDQDDTFKGALSNDNILGVGSNKSFYALNVDGAGGTNILDYQSNFSSYTAANNITLNIDLSNGIITKSGLINNKKVSSSDRVSAVTGDALINFGTILLDGAVISNTLIISDGAFKKNLLVNVVIGNGNRKVLQNLTFEKLNISTYVANILWEDNKISAKFNDVNNVNTELASATYTGFNNITLAGGKTTLTISSNVSNFYNNGSIRGVGVENTLVLISNAAQASSAVLLDLYEASITFDPEGNNTGSIYQLNNIFNFNLGFLDNIVYSSDVRSYNIEFSIASTTAEISYKKLSSATISLNITSIDNVNGAVSFIATKSRGAGGSASSNADVVTNAKKITLSDNDDKLILSSMGSSNGKSVIIDGAGGNNTVSLAGFSSGISLSIGTSIKFDGFDLQNFSSLELTNYDDVVQLELDSQLTIDGGKGSNTVDYRGLIGLVSALTLTDSLDKNNNFYISVTKNGMYIDTLINFNNILLNNAFNNHIYNATAVNYGTASYELTIDFNTKDITSGSNTMNYGGIVGSGGIQVMVEQAISNSQTTNKATVQRNLKDSNSIKDNLIGVNVIQGTGKGDVFEVSSKVQNLTIDGVSGGELSIDYQYDKNNNFFVWDLSSKSVASGTSSINTNVFLHFNGITTLEAVFDGKGLPNERVTNTFYVYDLSSSYNITADAHNVLATNALITLDFLNYAGDAKGIFSITGITTNTVGLFTGQLKAPGSSNTIDYDNITDIEGSNIADTNKFFVNLNIKVSNKSIDKQGVSHIIGKHINDSITFALNQKGTNGTKYSFVANFSTSNLVNYYYISTLNGVSKYGDIIQGKNISNIVIDNNIAFNNSIDFTFSNLISGSYKVSHIKSVSVPMNLDFTSYGTPINVNLNTSELYIFDGNSFTFSAIDFKTVNIDLGESSTGSLTLTGNSSLLNIASTYTGFTTINVQDGNNYISGSYNNLSAAPLIDTNGIITLNGQNIRFNTLISANNDININLPSSNSGNQFIVLGMDKIFNQKVYINTPTTAFDGKSKLIVVFNTFTMPAGANGIYIELNSLDAAIFGHVSNMATGDLVSNSKLLTVHNVTAIGSYNQNNNFYLKYGNDFQYFSTAAANVAATIGAHGIFQYLKVGSSGSLVLDYTELQGNAISLEGVSGGKGITRFNDKGNDEFYGLYMGFNGVDPDWNKGNGQVSLEVNADGLFNNTTIIAPNTGIQKFNVTAGFFRGFLAANSNHTFIIDGSAHSDAKINVSNGDVDVSFKGSLFKYDISFSAAKDNGDIITNYELSTIDTTNSTAYSGTKGVFNNLHWKILNVGYYNSAKNIDNNFYLSKSLDRSIFLGGGEVQASYSENQFNTINFAYVDNSEADFTFSLGSKSVSGDFKEYSSNINGTINKHNVSLMNFSQIIFGEEGTLYDVTTQSSKVYVTMDFFPNFNPVSNGISSNQIAYRNKANIIFKHYRTPSKPITSQDDEYFNQTLDLTTLTNVSDKILVEIDSSGLATFWKSFQTSNSNASGKVVYTFDIDKTGNSFKAQNFTVLNLSHNGASVIQNQVAASYKIVYSGYSNNIYAYNLDLKTIVSNNEVHKYIGANEYVDFLTSVNTILIGTNHIIVKSQQHDINSTNTKENTYIIDVNDNMHNVSYNYALQDIDQFNLVVTGIGKGDDKIVVSLNNVSKFNLSTDGISHYRIAFVDSDEYIDNIGHEKSFDAKGYFAIEDTNTGNFFYFTGDNLSKYSRIFDELLHSKGSIDKFSSYKEMLEALENNTHANEKYEDPKSSDDNNSKEDTSSSYENSNHAYVEKIKPENGSKENTVENSNETNNKVEEHATNIDSNILNIVHEEESNNACLDIKANDVLDGFNKNSHNLDNLSNDVFNYLDSDKSNTSEEHSAKESLDNIINSIKEVSSVVEKSNLEITLVVHDNDYNHEDPTSKLDNMLYKENSLNGHNHK